MYNIDRFSNGFSQTPTSSCNSPNSYLHPRNFLPSFRSHFFLPKPLCPQHPFLRRGFKRFPHSIPFLRPSVSCFPSVLRSGQPPQDVGWNGEQRLSTHPTHHLPLSIPSLYRPAPLPVVTVARSPEISLKELRRAPLRLPKRASCGLFMRCVPVRFSFRHTVPPCPFRVAVMPPSSVFLFLFCSCVITTASVAFGTT